MRYQIHDTWGAPQCGCDIIDFLDYDTMFDYIDNTEGLAERIQEGYATIVTVSDATRNMNRIKPFCEELSSIWRENCNDWRFGQFILNVFDTYAARTGKDAFYLEDDEMLDMFRKFFVEQ